MNKHGTIQLAYFIMKFSLPQMLIIALLTTAVYATDTNGQEILNRKISFSVKNKDLKEILKIIEKQAPVRFNYSDNIIESGRKKSLNVVDVELRNVLDSLLDANITYEVIGKEIVLRSLISENFDPFLPKSAIDFDHRIAGKVTDESGVPLPGVNVLLKGTTTGTTTDAEGKYSLNVIDGNGTLVFSFIGYTTEEAVIGNRTVIDISLVADIKSLSEVVVVGYGTQKRQEITSAIASVKAENFVKGSVTDASQLIRGKVAGLSVITPDANPTSTAQISLRGVTTLKAGTGPLVLIDGVPGTLTTVAPEDIESIDVLKDGSAAAIYGTRGTNGVILITTKKVNEDIIPTIEINSYITTQRITKKLDFMNASEYRQLVAEGRPGATDYGFDTNWLEEVTQDPVSQVHNISLRGGSRITNYIVNLNYRDVEGIIKKSDNKIIYPRLEINHSMFDSKLKFNVNISGYQQKYFAGADGVSFNNSVYRNGLNYNPTDRLKDDNGKWIERVEKTDYANPVALLEETKGLNQNTNLRTYGTITYYPIDGVTINLLGSRDMYNSVRGYYETKQHYSTSHDGKNGYASRGTTGSQEDLLELTAQYNKTLLGEHHLAALGGYSWRKTNFEEYWMQNWDFPTDDFSYNKMQAGLALTRGQALENSYQRENKLVGYFFRLNYNFREKYLLMASIRHEGSSKFGVNHKWGNFPAVSVGWNVQKESFLQNLKVVSTLKLRSGFGITGTEPLDPYMSLNRLNFDTYTFFNGQWIQSINPSTNANPNLRWEKKEELNVGLDYGFLNDRIWGSIDLYKRTTKDLLMDYTVPTPPYLYNTIIANAASMENKGIEIQLNIAAIETKDFKWNTSVNYSSNKNKLLSLSDENFQLASGYFDAGNTGEPIQQTTHRVQVGQPVGNFYGYKTVDIDENGHWIIQGKNGESKPIAQQQADDEQIIGNGLPKHYLAWNNTLVYKNFDLNITMRGAFGFQILNIPSLFYNAPVMLTRGNLLASAYDNVYGKRPLADDQELQYVSYYIEKGDYWKIDNITLGYNLRLNSKYIKIIRLYVSGSNLKTFTDYSGIDPEVSINVLNPGVDDKNRYPATSTYTLGAFFTF